MRQGAENFAPWPCMAMDRMNQEELRELENRCIQEEPPACAARCPIHVDVRDFLKKAASGAWDEAFNILAITMPLPGIVARICDHPCELACRRREAGDAIAISGLERATAGWGRITKRRTPLPRKMGHVAIAGSGLSSLTAAWDLAHKGYRVTILEVEDQLGEELRGIYGDVLPREVIEDELGVLKRLGVETGPGITMNSREWLDAIIADFDAVYVGLDPGRLFDSGILPEADPFTLAASRAGLFVGGKGRKETAFSPIESVAEGRRGAISIDRFLQRVSLIAGREKEGPYETKLFTSLEHVTPQPEVPMKDPSGYSEIEAMDEAKRCLQCECMECVKVCLYLERFKSYPKQYIRQIYNNETILIGSHGLTNRLINSCSLCGLCAEVCPHDLSMAPVCMEGRVGLVDRNKMPPSAHDFALEDMAFNNSDCFALTRHEPGTHRSTFMFFPGCQLGGSSPERVEQAYGYLRERLSGGVGLMLRCCNAPALWAGHDDLFLEELGTLRKEWEAAGMPRVVLACPTCYKIFKEHLPDVGIASLWELLDEIGLPPAHDPRHAGSVTVHDPCTARLEEAMQESVRRLLRLMGYSPEELELGGRKTECCGYGGLMSSANPALGRDVAKRRAHQADNWVTYCAMCRDALAVGDRPVVHILDLLFEGPAVWKTAGRAGPGYSARHEMRARLREKMLSHVFDGGEREMADWEKIVLCVSPEAYERMQERRILLEDVRRVIDHAEKTGAKVRSKETGHWLASFRPDKVTYWVEYEGTREGYTVYNSYCHRMEIVSGHPR